MAARIVVLILLLVMILIIIIYYPPVIRNVRFFRQTTKFFELVDGGQYVHACSFVTPEDYPKALKIAKEYGIYASIDPIKRIGFESIRSIDGGDRRIGKVTAIVETDYGKNIYSHDTVWIYKEGKWRLSLENFGEELVDEFSSEL